jgi:transposase InsO family protein
MAGGSQKQACQELGISERTFQRWMLNPGAEDGRRGPNAAPAHKLTEEEKREIIEISTSPEFRDKSPHQIVPTLVDRGRYVASEASFYRVLKAHSLLAHRGRSKPRNAKRPKGYEATKPRQLFSWDITYLKTNILGRYYFLYMFIDVFSRKIVGAEVHDCESPEHSSRLLQWICNAEKIDKQQLSVHADNGGPMKGATMLATMQKLGVMPSFSRPSVKDDNPFSEALFKTMKYCPQFPSKPFVSLENAQEWVAKFVLWYNEEHLHSAISFTTPSSRHAGTDEVVLQKREEVYRKARENNSQRWSGKTRSWEKIAAVRLNWLKDDESSAKQINIRSVS